MSARTQFISDSPREKYLLALAVAGLAWFSSGLSAKAAADTAGLAFFENKIRPVFVEHCYSCHSADSKKVRGGLKLDTREDFLKGGTDGAIVAAGQPDQSSLIKAVRYEDKDLQMPPNKDGGKKLLDTVIADLVQWVKMGAPYPETPKGKLAGKAKPWSFDPVRNPALPKVKNKKWAATSIDPFILSKLEAAGVQPAPKADKRALIRRATFDLTGLPPTPEEVAAFEKDHSSNAFAKVVDRLLCSPHYGERWGRHWLDVVRYADTAGDTADYPVGLAWRYRNYVIDAFNADKPYNEFLTEQIAGDILAGTGSPDRYAERVTATGFVAISRRFGFDSENYHHLTIQDTLDTLGQTVLGLSVGCARCHDHKFDPISMQDYYGLYGIFASTRYAFPGSEQKAKMRSMVPLLPPEASQPRLREYDLRVAALSDRIAKLKGNAPSAVFRSLHDPDGDFETQKDAAGGSYGVIVPPWLAEGKMSVTLAAQSPFKNLYPQGKFGANIFGGTNDYRLAQTLHPGHSSKSDRVLHLNLDFRAAAPEAGASGKHHFWVGDQAGTAAVEICISSEGLYLPSSGTMEKLADLKPHEWHNLELTLDLEKRTFSGTLDRTGNTASFDGKPFTSGWSGIINQVQLDSKLRGAAPLPQLEVDNFALQSAAILPTTTNPPSLAAVSSSLNPDALNAELKKLVGVDGDLEWQTEGAQPVSPWNPGPKSAVKIATTAQSPFRNLYPAGKLGIQLPNRGEYDGFGITLLTPWKSDKTEQLFVSFDFQLGAQAAGGDGSWRFYVGHGPGNSAAIELFLNGRQFTANAGAANEFSTPLRNGEWHQVQLALNLKEKTFTGTLATGSGSVPFSGALGKSWDGTIDYSFIDSYGHRPGVRPELHADNFAFSETPLPSLGAPALVETDNERMARRSRVAELRQRLAALAEEASKDAKELTELLVKGPCDMTYGVVEGTPRNERIQLRGEPEKPGNLALRGFIASLGGKALPAGIEGSGRLQLAQWLTSPQNPLTARVMVNRIWEYHFGHGLIATPNDFGVRGQKPTHPELLDHLATRFMQSGWSIKAMHRLIMLSSTYQEASPTSGMPASAAEYATFERRRLSAEELRDSILAISGELDPTPGREHPFPSPVSSSYTQHGPFSGVYDHNQRSVYLMTQRIKRHPFLALFDGPDPNASTAFRRTTTVPTQALYFLNSPFVHEKAEKCAVRLNASCADDASRVEQAWRLTTGRAPTPSEQAEAAEFLSAYRAELSATGQKDSGAAALSAYIRSLFGSNEFLHLD